jgi:parvulin-like peptidyl-prolyl isomerase
MKTLAIGIFAAAMLCGQDPVKITPGTPAVKAPAEPGQPVATTPPPPVAPDTVVAEVDGKKITAAEMDKIIGDFPSNNQQALRANPGLLSQVFMMRRLMEDAEKAGVDKQSPYREQLITSRLQFLAQTEINVVGNAMAVTEEDEHKYYNENPDKFKEVKVRAIFVAFNNNPAALKAVPDTKKLPTEAEAKAKIENLEKEIKAGADFGKLARENSDDQASAAKDGDFGSVNEESAYPSPIKAAVFALKKGELSAPLRQPGGFYLLRAEEVGQQPFGDIFGQIAQTLRKAKSQEWLKGLLTQYNVKVENPAYFAPRVPAQLQQVH